MQRTHRIGVGLLALMLFASGCYGPFNLTRRLYQWNGQAGTTKWEREFVFILLAWLPVYGLTVLGDAVVFNSMEFWTGNNPVEPPSRKSALPQTKRVARGASEALLTYASTPAGSELLVEQFRQSQPAGSLHIQQRDGMTVGFDANGEMLFTATSLADGSVVVTDVKTQRVASYSNDQVEDFLSSTRQ